MKKHTVFGALVIAAALTLTGCGTSSTTNTSAKTHAAAKTSAPTKVPAETHKAKKPKGNPCDAKDGSNRIATENPGCHPKKGVYAERDVITIQDAEAEHVGDWAVFEKKQDGPRGLWKVKVSSYETTRTIKDGAENPDWDGGDTGEYMNATADPGHTFHVITFTMKNIGNAPSASDADFTLYGKSGGKWFTPSSDDDSFAINVMDNLWNVDAGIDINPGETTTLVAVIQTLDTVKGEAIMMQDPYIDSESLGATLELT